MTRSLLVAMLVGAVIAAPQEARSGDSGGALVSPAMLVRAPTDEGALSGKMEQVVYGAPGCCSCCDQKCRCRKRTRVVCEMKKVTRHCWTCECEDICTLLPRSLFGFSLCGGSASGRGDCADCCDACSGGEAPKIGRCRTRKVLVLKEYTVETPVYKCVVEYCCPDCGDAVGDAPTSPTGSAATTAPKKDAAPRVALLPRDKGGYGE